MWKNLHYLPEEVHRYVECRDVGFCQVMLQGGCFPLVVERRPAVPAPHPVGSMPVPAYPGLPLSVPWVESARVPFQGHAELLARDGIPPVYEQNGFGQKAHRQYFVVDQDRRGRGNVAQLADWRRDAPGV